MTGFHTYGLLIPGQTPESSRTLSPLHTAAAAQSISGALHRKLSRHPRSFCDKYQLTSIETGATRCLARDHFILAPG